MFDPELEQAVEKMQKSDAPMSKSDQYQQLKKFSNRQRLPTESPEQAFTRFITKDPDGRVLYQNFVRAKGASFAPAPESASDDNGDSAGLQKLRKIAAEIRSKDPMLSPQQATALALRTPAGAQAALEDRKARVG
jgi:hypothetical protein